MPVNANLVPIAILRSGPHSWAEIDLTNPRPRFDQDSDEPGPVTVGVAVQERAPMAAGSAGSTAESGPRPRLVLFSSRSLADNVVQGIEPTNLDLLMNAASWLRGRPDAVGITASTHVALTLTADPVAPVAPGPCPHRHGRARDHRRGNHCLRGPARVSGNLRPLALA